MMERVRRAYRSMLEDGIRVTYAVVECPSLSSCLMSIEKAIGGARFRRLVDPDCYSLMSTAEEFAVSDFTILEVRGELNRAFYLLPLPDLPPGQVDEKFKIAFRVKNPRGVAPLVRYICEGKIGKRHANRSAINLVISFLVGLTTSAFSPGRGLLVQLLLSGALALAAYFILDYPLSLLHLKGVDTASEKKSGRVFTLKIWGKRA